MRILTSKATYRRWVYLVLGGAISVPYILFAAVAVPSLLPFVTTLGRATVVGGLLTLTILAGTAFLPAVHVLESTAVRELLDDPVPDAPAKPPTRPGRRRAAAMFVLHVVAGCAVSFFSLAAPVAIGLSVSAVFTGHLFQTGEGDQVTVPTGWASVWLPVAFLCGLVLLVYAVRVVGGLLRRAATVLLGTTAADRIARLERRTEQLAERNRLARELHDSVGHALSVVTIQAGAARRTLHTDPAFTERALTAIEESARTALDDLDHVLGLLREEPAGRAPQPALTALPALLETTRLAGTEVTADIGGDLAAVPPVVSREVYRILQECLTNAVRHAGGVPVTVVVGVGAHELTARVGNPLGNGPDRTGGGRGLRGMTERVAVLGGELSAGPVGERWEVVVRVPWGSGR
ncbi:sensor histidine kinase [Amycolatopsis vancoresmycina]|uniref:histidine kinase n=1 Tax=Amycolatopsis vancoresmycina DSM 44592 TaxID=1292037 RepID=R1HYG9_9PSEU|nr:histidine kinase [Amycolatopsis vancoresmycina]EOD68555.1 two-component system histidine kinase [Amycolatopsis vancoresmycina DSM 44592]